jgi:hypothetical protein
MCWVEHVPGVAKTAYRYENGGDQKNSLSKFISYGGK